MLSMEQSKRSLILRIVFMAWERIGVKTLNAALEEENERLKNLLGKQSESIWVMRKVDLVNLAVKEIGMTRTDAEKDTVLTLREKIQRQRQVTRETEDPLLKVPTGLEKMLHHQLQDECRKRNIPVKQPGTDKDKTRASMILDTRDDVDLRKFQKDEFTMVTSDAMQTEEPSSGSGSRRRRE